MAQSVQVSSELTLIAVSTLTYTWQHVSCLI